MQVFRIWQIHACLYDLLKRHPMESQVSCYHFPGREADLLLQNFTLADRDLLLFWQITFRKRCYFIGSRLKYKLCCTVLIGFCTKCFLSWFIRTDIQICTGKRTSIRSHHWQLQLSVLLRVLYFYCTIGTVFISCLIRNCQRYCIGSGFFISVNRLASCLFCAFVSKIPRIGFDPDIIRWTCSIQMWCNSGQSCHVLRQNSYRRNGINTAGMVVFCTAFTVISVFVIASDFVIINLSRFCGRILIAAFRCALYTGKFFFAIFFSVNLIQFCARIRCSILQIYPEASWFCCKFRFLRRGQIKGIVFRKCLTVISCFIYRDRFDLICDIFW